MAPALFGAMASHRILLIFAASLSVMACGNAPTSNARADDLVQSGEALLQFDPLTSYDHALIAAAAFTTRPAAVALRGSLVSESGVPRYRWVWTFHGGNGVDVNVGASSAGVLVLSYVAEEGERKHFDPVVAMSPLRAWANASAVAVGGVARSLELLESEEEGGHGTVLRWNVALKGEDGQLVVVDPFLG